MNEDPTIRWLLDGDPAVVFQTERDLLGAPARVWQRTRRRVATEGWGLRLLACRALDGTWGGGLYNPKWTSTFYTLKLLCELGIAADEARAAASCELLMREGVGEDGAVRLWRGPLPDTCVCAMLLTMACHFGRGDDARARRMEGWLLGEQMADGGWNCRRRRGARHSSFHSTISALEALAALPGRGAVRLAAAERARAFFLEHQLYRSSTTGKVVRASFAKLSFPPHWYFDVLRGLEHFRVAGSSWDERLGDAVALVRRRRRADGRWMAEGAHAGRVHFALEPARTPSRMNTLRALRVLGWADHARAGEG